ncbi:MAG: glycosyltransferase family 4 protein [Patescibacteria group bacterium]
MKITYIADVRLPTEKAHGVQIMKSCEAFVLSGATVELIIPDRENPIKKDPFDYYGVERIFSIRKIKSPSLMRFEKYLGALAFRLQVAGFLSRLALLRVPKETIVYTRSTEVAWLFSMRGYKTVFEAHVWPETKISLFVRLLSKVYLIVCNSGGTEEEFKKRGMNTLAVPNGVDLSMFDIKADPILLREKLGLPQDKKVILYTGHLYAWKGVDVVFKAASLMKDDPHVVFVLVGGTQKDIEKYKNLVQNNALDNVMLLGHKEQKALPEFLRASDALLIPNIPISIESEKYTSPIKMFEYMASGRPIIASDMPSMREILNEKNATLITPGSAEALKAAIHDLRDTGAEARRDVENFTWEKRALKILSKISTQ